MKEKTDNDKIRKILEKNPLYNLLTEWLEDSEKPQPVYENEVDLNHV